MIKIFLREEAKTLQNKLLKSHGYVSLLIWAVTGCQLWNCVYTCYELRLNDRLAQHLGSFYNARSWDNQSFQIQLIYDLASGNLIDKTEINNLIRA